jgi:hypothetical protein
VVNGWDLLIDNNKDKTIITRFGVNLGDPLTFGLSYYTGVEQASSDDWRNSVDLTGVTKIVPRVALNFQANYGAEMFSGMNAKWFGFGVQPVVTVTDNFDLGFRAEYFADDQGVRTGAPYFNAFNLTLTPMWKCEGMLFRAEFRFDNSNKEIFYKMGGFEKTSATISLGVSSNL